jgi:predicted Abi (CAAX) family protease
MNSDTLGQRLLAWLTTAGQTQTWLLAAFAVAVAVAVAVWGGG